MIGFNFCVLLFKYRPKQFESGQITRGLLRLLKAPTKVEKLLIKCLKYHPFTSIMSYMVSWFTHCSLTHTAALNLLLASQSQTQTPRVRPSADKAVVAG